ncbi:hypothetical protein, partial [Mesorhizobium silamurunense]|uniref:hypothetical protein n=1 Tax=Mesorhizobium silamurunense TaxID=499528 RepID=UPI001AEDEBD1
FVRVETGSSTRTQQRARRLFTAALRAQSSDKPARELSEATRDQGTCDAESVAMSGFNRRENEPPEKRFNANIDGVSEPALRASRIAEEIVAAA